MLLFLATGDSASNPHSILVNAVVAIVSGLTVFVLKVIADRRSEKVLFDHRLRLEKEYKLYSDLWEKLFELRRAVGQMVSSFDNTASVRHDEQICETFNAYQGVVSRGEPFMSESRAVKIISRAVNCW